MNITAIIVTRGDVDLTPILDQDWPEAVDQKIVWTNSGGIHFTARRDVTIMGGHDLAVYGRYAAIKGAKNELIFTQDDDIVFQPGAIEKIVSRWYDALGREWDHSAPGVVCNMPANFRHAFYQEHSLVGFGACFYRDAPERAFRRFWSMEDLIHGLPADAGLVDEGEFFHRTCDIVFTALTPRILVDVPYDDLPWASAPNRMWKQPTHREERGRMLDLVLEVRDAA